MKKLIVVILTLMLASIAGAASADIHNNGAIVNGDLSGVPASGDYVAYFEDYAHITYVWKFTFVDSSDKYHTRPIYIGNVNVSDAYINAVQSATGDANIIFHFSADDRNTWQSTTAAGMDATSNTAKQDTIGIEAGVDDIKYHSARWMVVECLGGSTSNQDDNVMKMILKFKKETPTTVKGNGDYVRLSRVARTSNTNP